VFAATPRSTSRWFSQPRAARSTALEGGADGSLGGMKLYADLPGRRTLQILADLGMLAWICLWGWVGRLVHDATMAGGGAARRPS